MTEPPHTMLAEINAIQKMSVNQLLCKYARFFTGNQTRCTATLRQEAIYRLQEEHYNLRISDATIAVLNASLEKREERRKGRESLLPGTPHSVFPIGTTARRVKLRITYDTEKKKDVPRMFELTPTSEIGFQEAPRRLADALRGILKAKGIIVEKKSDDGAVAGAGDSTGK